MGVKSAAKGIRTCALLVPDDGRNNGSPRPVPGSERGREGRPTQLTGGRSAARASSCRSAPPPGDEAQPSRNPPQAPRTRHRTALAVQPGEAEPRYRASADD
jgi:hypothetical protein